MQTTIFIIFAALISEIAGTMAGFGSSSIFLPLLSNILDFKNALVLVAIYHIFGNASRLYVFCRHINTRVFLLFGIPSIVCTVVGAMLVQYIDQMILKMILGVVLTLLAVYSLLHPKRKIEATQVFGVIGGGISGLTAGLVGTGGVIRGLFMSMFQLPKEQYIATIAAIALAVDFTRIPIYFSSGFLDKGFWMIIPILLGVAYIGSYIGRVIINYMSEKIFRKVILVGIIVLSLVFVYQGIIYLTVK